VALSAAAARALDQHFRVGAAVERQETSASNSRDGPAPIQHPGGAHQGDMRRRRRNKLRALAEEISARSSFSDPGLSRHVTRVRRTERPLDERYVTSLRERHGAQTPDPAFTD
jgi:hypothetical protein